MVRSVTLPVLVLLAGLFPVSGSSGQESRPAGGTPADPAAGESWRISVSAHAGYGFVLMKDVNADLQRTQDSLKRVGGPDADKVRGGTYYDGEVTARRGPLVLGAIVSHQTAEGGTGYGDFTGKLDHRYDVRCLEVLAMAGYEWEMDRDATYSLGVALGYGRAASDYTYSEIVYSTPGATRIVEGKPAGTYLAARLLGAIHYHLGRVAVDIGGGYRFANAGVLKGPLTENGRNAGDGAVRDARNREIGFDFSGLFLLAGLSLEL